MSGHSACSFTLHCLQEIPYFISISNEAAHTLLASGAATSLHEDLSRLLVLHEVEGCAARTGEEVRHSLSVGCSSRC